jgi:hypothetical protein
LRSDITRGTTDATAAVLPQADSAFVCGGLRLKSGGRAADTHLHWNQSHSANACRSDRTAGSIWWGSPRKDTDMQHLTGKYPRIAMIALIVCIAVASGAAKKWS